MKNICGPAREPHSCVCRSHSLLWCLGRGVGRGRPSPWWGAALWCGCASVLGDHTGLVRGHLAPCGPRILVAVAHWGLARLCAWQGGRTVSGRVGLMGRRVRKVRSAEAGLSWWRAGQCFTGRLPRLLTWGEARCLG